MSLRINDTVPDFSAKTDQGGADEDLKVAKLFDMLPAGANLPDRRTPADSATVRSVFIIGPGKKLKLSMTYPMTVGRNFVEVLRALDGLQTIAANGVATPANWEVGQDGIISLTVSDEEAKAMFGAFDAVFQYRKGCSTLLCAEGCCVV